MTDSLLSRVSSNIALDDDKNIVELNPLFDTVFNEEDRATVKKGQELQAEFVGALLSAVGALGAPVLAENQKEYHRRKSAGEDTTGIKANIRLKTKFGHDNIAASLTMPIARKKDGSAKALHVDIIHERYESSEYESVKQGVVDSYLALCK